ncbi:MAG TPA: transglycosylase SLT domain-containing protein [Kineosporiaceae bacterium]
MGGRGGVTNGGRRRAVWVLLPALLLTGCSVERRPASVAAASSRAATGTGSGGSSRTAGGPAGSGQLSDDPDPATYAALVTKYAREAGVHPQLVMAILYNESYKPHDPAFQRAWASMDPDASLGIANMHEAAFDDTKKGRPFVRREWQELPDDPGLAIEAEAWYLHDLAARLPSRRSSHYTLDELCALGYNAGPGNMVLFARGAPPGPQASAYLTEFRHNRAIAADALAKAS